MKKLRIFISCVQTEFAAERKKLWEYLTKDPLFGQFFDVFIFENLPASNQTAKKVYQDEVGKCNIYLGIFGKDYGYEDEEGISPTEREFDEAVRLSKTKLLFLTNHNKADRHPKAVIAEAIVNAVAHRDYTSTGSVQVMLFSDRLEVWNPGQLPPNLTIPQLKTTHGSFPANPLLAEPMFFAGYIERLGTGTKDMVRLCKESDLKEPEFKQEDVFKVIIWRKNEATGQPIEQVTGEATGEVAEEIKRVILVLKSEMKRADIQKELDLKHDDFFRLNYIIPALESGFVEMTHPDNPNHPNQKYRLTRKGIEIKKKLTKSEQKNE